MNGSFSLRRRLLLSMFCVFLLGVGTTTVFFRWELLDIQRRVSRLPSTSDIASIQLEQMVEEDIEFLGFILVPFTIAAMLVILAITHWSLRGIRRASLRAAQLDAAHQDARLETADLPDEIVPFVHAINGALERLAVALAAEQRLTANAAHELRTPLAVLQTRLQTAQLSGRIDWPMIDQGLAQLQRVIAQTLNLARNESLTRSINKGEQQSVNLARLLRETAAQLLPLVERDHRTLDIDAPDEIMMEGDAESLRDMLRNLVENALQHGRGTIRGTLACTTENGRAVVVATITDEGVGVPPAIQEAMFERFRKHSSQSSGAGLGLAIARQVARNHGGDVRFATDQRSAMTVVLPRALRDSRNQLAP